MLCGLWYRESMASVKMASRRRERMASVESRGRHWQRKRIWKFGEAIKVDIEVLFLAVRCSKAALAAHEVSEQARYQEGSDGARARQANGQIVERAAFHTTCKGRGSRLDCIH